MSSPLLGALHQILVLAVNTQDIVNKVSRELFLSDSNFLAHKYLRRNVAKTDPQAITQSWTLCYGPGGAQSLMNNQTVTRNIPTSLPVLSTSLLFSFFSFHLLSPLFSFLLPLSVSSLTLSTSFTCSLFVPLLSLSLIPIFPHSLPPSTPLFFPALFQQSLHHSQKPHFWLCISGTWTKTQSSKTPPQDQGTA